MKCTYGFAWKIGPSMLFLQMLQIILLTGEVPQRPPTSTKPNLLTLRWCHFNFPDFVTRKDFFREIFFLRWRRPSKKFETRKNLIFSVFLPPTVWKDEQIVGERPLSGLESAGSWWDNWANGNPGLLFSRLTAGNVDRVERETFSTFYFLVYTGKFECFILTCFSFPEKLIVLISSFWREKNCNFFYLGSNIFPTLKMFGNR